MRTDDMLRVGLECAAAAARGGDWTGPLARGVAAVLGTDVTYVVQLDPGWLSVGTSGQQVTTVGIGAPSPTTAGAATRALKAHPTIGDTEAAHPHVARVSDKVVLEDFWTTDVWRAVHGYGDGRYPASVVFGTFGTVHVFLGVHRCSRDFSDDDMEVFDRIREPLGAALAFRSAWDAAAASLSATRAPEWNQPLTRRESQVAALVSWGWTDARIGRHLHISERTVRKHLENVRAKWAAPNRTAVASRWNAIPG